MEHCVCRDSWDSFYSPKSMSCLTYAIELPHREHLGQDSSASSMRFSTFSWLSQINSFRRCASRSLSSRASSCSNRSFSAKACLPKASLYGCAILSNCASVNESIRPKRMSPSHSPTLLENSDSTPLANLADVTTRAPDAPSCTAAPRICLTTGAPMDPLAKCLTCTTSDSVVPSVLLLLHLMSTPASGPLPVNSDSQPSSSNKHATISSSCCQSNNLQSSRPLQRNTPLEPER